MKTILIIQNNNNPDDQWQKEVNLGDTRLVPIDYKIVAPMGDDAKFFTVEEARLYPSAHPIKDTSLLELIQRINPQVLQKFQLKKYGWTKMKNT